jgi:hypothetical protein
MNTERILYRTHQFWQALSAGPDTAELEAAQKVLTPPLMNLFSHQPAHEQMHSLRIFRGMLDYRETDQNLLIAGLLHDAGKSRYPLRLWERVIVVLCTAAFPEHSKRWGQSEAWGWKRAFVVAEQHASWGAEMAAQAGATPLTVALIRRHQEKPAQNSGSRDPFPNPEYHYLDPTVNLTTNLEVSLEDQLLVRLQFFDNEY